PRRRPGPRAGWRARGHPGGRRGRLLGPAGGARRVARPQPGDAEEVAGGDVVGLGAESLLEGGDGGGVVAADDLATGGIDGIAELIGEEALGELVQCPRDAIPDAHVLIQKETGDWRQETGDRRRAISGNADPTSGRRRSPVASLLLFFSTLLYSFSAQIPALNFAISSSNPFNCPSCWSASSVCGAILSPPALRSAIAWSSTSLIPAYSLSPAAVTKSS